MTLLYSGAWKRLEMLFSDPNFDANFSFEFKSWQNHFQTKNWEKFGQNKTQQGQKFESWSQSTLIRELALSVSKFSPDL